MTDIIYQLKAACTGRPAKVAWPHRLLHNAIKEITSLREENARLVGAIDGYFANDTKEYTAGGHHYYCSEARQVDPCDCAYGRLMNTLDKAKNPA